jgi:hypothetical protein
MNFWMVDSWDDLNDNDPAIRRTFGCLRIVLGNVTATEVSSSESRSVRDFVRVPLYPIAEWFAESWWRLMWESAPAERDRPSWSLAHEMPSIGQGYVWPPVCVSYDGEVIDVSCERTDYCPTEPIRYLSRGHVELPQSDFESQVEEFVTFVIRRLDDSGIANTNLHAIWSDLLDERSHDEYSEYRRWEARLGYDPEDAPSELVDNCRQLASFFGEQATAEVASASSGSEATARLKLVSKLLQQPSYVASFEPVLPIRESARSMAQDSRRPWERGYLVANSIRQFIGNEQKPIGDGELSELLGLGGDLQDPTRNSALEWIDLGVRETDSDEWNLVFSRPYPDSRRFAAARYLGDWISAPTGDRWLPLTDTHSARQQFQRAFAAQLLCPVQGLADKLGGQALVGRRIEDAAAYFGVSPLVVKHQVDNHRLASIW